MPDNQYFLKNIALLQPDTAQLLQGISGNGQEESEVLLSRTGCPVPRFKGKLIHSSYDPQKEADAFAGEQTPGEGMHIILFGFGFGYHVEALRRRFPENKLYCFDFFPSLLASACRERDFTSLFGDPSFQLFCHSHLEEFLASFQALHKKLNPETCHAVVYNPLMKSAKKEFQKVLQALDRMEMGRKLPRLFGGIEKENFLKNKDLLIKGACSSLAQLRNSFREVPALIVGAGPSLDALLPFIFPLQEKLLIIATDAALSPLRANGIEPHLLISIDPQKSVLRHFAEHRQVSVPVIIVPTSSPKIVKRVEGEKIFMIQEEHPLIKTYPLLKELGTTKAGNSVSCFALDAALQMGCSPLLLAGLDNGFPQMRAYAKHTVMADAGEAFISSHQLVETADMFFSPLATHQNLYEYLRTIEALITTTEKPVYHIGPLGAHIEGALPLSVTEAGFMLSQLPDRNILREEVRKTVRRKRLTPSLRQKFRQFAAQKEGKERMQPG